MGFDFIDEEVRKLAHKSGKKRTKQDTERIFQYQANLLRIMELGGTEGDAALDELVRTLSPIVNLAIYKVEPHATPEERQVLTFAARLVIKDRAQHYEVERGKLFASYAYWDILEAVKKFSIETPLVSAEITIPSPGGGYKRKARHTEQRPKNNRQNTQPDGFEIFADTLSTHHFNFRRASETSRNVMMQGPAEYGDPRTALYDRQPNAEQRLLRQNLQSYQRRLFQEALAMLDERAQDIIAKRHLAESDDDIVILEDLAKRHGISRERVRQIEKRALETIRLYVKRRRISDAIHSTPTRRHS